MHQIFDITKVLHFQSSSKNHDEMGLFIMLEVQ